MTIRIRTLMKLSEILMIYNLNTILEESSLNYYKIKIISKKYDA